MMKRRSSNKAVLGTFGGCLVMVEVKVAKLRLKQMEMLSRYKYEEFARLLV